MKKISSILFIIMLVVIATIISGAATDTYIEQNKPSVLERLLNEFVVNNINFKYPIKINDSITLTSRELIKLQDNLFVVENFKLMAAKKDFAISIEEFRQMTYENVSADFCSQERINEKEHLFTGYSEVGLLQRMVDLNDEFVMEVRLEKSLCTTDSFYKKIDLAYDVSLEVPLHWITLTENTKNDIRAAAEALLGEQNKSTKINLLLMNSSIENHECQFRVSAATSPVISSEEIKLLQKADLEEYTTEMRMLYAEMNKKQSYVKVTSVENSYTKILNGRAFLVLPYIRDSIRKNDPTSWRVEVHQTSTKESNYIITSSYRMSGDITCEIILSKVLNSLEIKL